MLRLLCMEKESRASFDSRRSQTEAQIVSSETNQAGSTHPKLLDAIKRLEQAKERFLSAAIAFCDGSISAGQLRTARELMREKELQLAQLERGIETPIIEEPLPEKQPTELEEVETGPLEVEPIVDLTIPPEIPPLLKQKLVELNQKLKLLEEDYKRGHINPSQYQAIQRHYLQQREVALRISETHPDSDRWQVVLEEGKTTFLMQLNEATCHSVGIYDVNTRERIFVYGNMPTLAEEAMALLGTFGSSEPDSTTGRMYATQTEDGSSLLLIPGLYTVCLVVFSQAPPDWQVRALREVHRHFETANKGCLERGERQELIFPNLRRFIRGLSLS